MINSIIENKLKKYNFQRQMIFGACVLKKHTKWVMQFDLYYNMDLSSYFVSKINEIILSDTNLCLFCNEEINNILCITPDTESFPDIEGSMAQNALIAMIYIVQFFNSKNLNDIMISIGKYYETKDLLNINSGSPMNSSECKRKTTTELNDIIIGLEKIDIGKNNDVLLFIKNII